MALLDPVMALNDLAAGHMPNPSRLINPDPSKFVPIAAFMAVQAHVTALCAKNDAREFDQ